MTFGWCVVAYWLLWVGLVGGCVVSGLGCLFYNGGC